MGSSNFLRFDFSGTNLLSDSDYNSSTAREDGVSGQASSALHNKIFYQTSAMVAALGQVMADLGETVSDATYSSLVVSVKKIFAGQLFESPPQTITSGGTLTIPHGLGAAPTSIECYVRCTTAEGGYSVGDTIRMNDHIDQGSTTKGHAILVGSTNLTVYFSNPGDGAVYSTFNPTNGTVALTNANWKLIIRARI